MRILVIEDSVLLQRALVTALRRAEFAVDAASDGQEGLERALAFDYDAIVLDLWLPRLDGTEVLKRVREKRDDVPILVLTARDGVEDRVAGLNAGADDYLVKPFAFPELIARLRALCGRRYGSRRRTLTIGDLCVDLAGRTASRGTESIELTSREFALLELLALRRGGVVPRRDIETRLYDDRVDPTSNAVDAAICRLRRKIDRPGLSPLVHTRRGEGYSLGARSAS
jgi:DNA-binding response OmpR family regulator